MVGNDTGLPLPLRIQDLEFGYNLPMRLSRLSGFFPVRYTAVQPAPPPTACISASIAAQLFEFSLGSAQGLLPPHGLPGLCQSAFSANRVRSLNWLRTGTLVRSEEILKSTVFKVPMR